MLHPKAKTVLRTAVAGVAEPTFFGMGSSQSTPHLPPSSAAIMLYLAQQRFEKEAPWKRDQLTKQVRSDPDELALSCWAVACEQPPGASALTVAASVEAMSIDDGVVAAVGLDSTKAPRCR